MRALWAAAVAAGVALAACGGAPASKEPPKDGSGTAKKEATDAPPSTTPPVKKSPCADGTCTECGEGICPAGYFCVDTKGHKGCAWLAACIDKPLCSCVSREVKACACKDEGGVARVTCGG